MASTGEGGMLNLPVIDFAKFNQKGEDVESYNQECRKVSEAFREYGKSNFKGFYCFLLVSCVVWSGGALDSS